jgi:hypothetical protein
MEAATPLRKSHVHTVGDRLTIDGLVVDDECAVRLVREREQAGEDAAQTVTDAIEIGARVLDREHAAANAEYVKTEFERTSRQVEQEFSDKARKVAEHFGQKVDEVFSPENGHLAKEFEKLFSDGSSASVQNRMRELLADTLQKSREDLVRQFSAEDGTSPLAGFKEETVRVLDRAERRQQVAQQAMLEQMAALDKQLQALRLEKEKLEEVAEERERGTAKGRTFEEQVAEAVDAIAVAQGDDAEAVGDLKGSAGRTGDVVVGIEGCSGPARGRVVFEAKDRRLSKPRALEELDKAMRDRDADFAVLVVPSDEEVPAKLQTLREYNGDKLVVTLDPDEGSALALELAYRLARARVLMARGSAEGVDAAAVRDTVQRALHAMDEVRRIKSTLTGAVTSIEKGKELVDAMASRVRAHLDEVDELMGAEEGDDAPLPPLDDDEQPELTLD